MMMNDRTEIIHTVSKPNSRRRVTNAIMTAPHPPATRAPPSPPGAEREGVRWGDVRRATLPSRLVVPRLGMRAARRAAVLRDARPPRQVHQPPARQPHAHQRRRLPAGADGELLVHHDLPDLLRDLVAVLLLL